MSEFFIMIYRLFHEQKKMFYGLLVIFIAFIVFFSARIRFEEDITKTISNEGEKDPTGFVVKNLKITDKLVVDISWTDSMNKPDPTILIDLGQQLVDSLYARFDTNYIQRILFQASDSAVLSVMEMVMKHLPSFLEEKDYLTIDSLISPEAVDLAFDKNRKILSTPASMALRKKIQQDPLGISNQALVKLKSLQDDDNYTIIDGCIFSQDLHHLLFFIVPANPSNETAKNSRLINGMDEIIGSITSMSHPKANIGYFGAAAMSVCNATQLKKDIALTLTIAITLIFLLIGWYFRSIRVPILSLLPALFGGGLSLAILSVTRGSISAISLGIGSVILGLIVDYTLYIVTLYRRKDNIETVLKEMSLTIVLCSLTTAGAFLCLVFLNSGVLHDLGWFAAISVMGAAIFALIILPHLLPGKENRKPIATGRKPIDKIASFRFEKSYPLIIIFVILLIVSFFFANKVEFERNMNSLSFTTPGLKKTESSLDKISNYKLKNLYVVSTGPTIEQALRTKEKLDSRFRDLQKEGIIQGISGAGLLLQSDSLQQEKIDRWNRYWTTDRKRQLTETILKTSGKYGFRPDAFRNFINLVNQRFEPLSANNKAFLNNPALSDWITITSEKVLSPVILKVKEKDLPWLSGNFKGLPNIVAFDKQSLTSQFVETVKHDFDLLVKLSMGFVTLLLIVLLGRFGLGLMTALPMFISWYITLGFMGMTGIRFNIFNIIISSFIFGLGVDYSILMLRGLQHAYKTGKNDLSSYKVSVILSSATTLFGVSALFFARHPALHSIALISVIGIVLVVLMSFILLPLLFNGTILSRKEKNTFPVTLRILVNTLVTWGNIVLIAIILMILGGIIKFLLPVSRIKKEKIFHRLFSWLTKCYIAFTFAFDRKLINETGEDFRQPAVIISNHQSLIETPAFLRLYPKILILTTSWVYRSPIFGPIARLASFFNVDQGIENILEPLRAKISEGYSILIFPEGHRSADQKIQRFHRGAFYLSEKLNIDILPVLVFGSGDFLAKDEFWGKPNSLRMKILPRITSSNALFGTTYQEKAHLFRQFYNVQYAAFKAEEGDAHYYRRNLILNYVLKGPILEWYLRTKLKLEDDYEMYNQLMPRRGRILDLGCGFGFISYMLMFTGDERSITGVDYDQEKITIAENCFSKNERIRFFCEDVSSFEITRQDGFLLSDVLHYLTHDQQDALLRKCFSNLNPGGVILIREANAELQQRHKKSVLTEIFSTRSGFNKTSNPQRELFFTSSENIRKIADEFGLKMEIIDTKIVTSNNLFV
ncbi:MAG: MMPL family transporter, partial [Bacteroidales bacterium]|nr:MMPL family transporter [Bacteroidales bacterium]